MVRVRKSPPQQLRLEEIVRHLRGVAVLRLLTEPELAALASRCRTIATAMGQPLFVPGDSPAVYTLIRGRVTILRRPAPGVELELFIRTRGQLFGEASLFLGRQVDEARAETSALAIRIAAKALRPVLVNSSTAAQALGLLLAERLEIAEARLSEGAIHSVPKRLLLLLERLARAAAIQDGRGLLLPDYLTHDELAHLLGTTRESVSRALGQLRREGDGRGGRAASYPPAAAHPPVNATASLSKNPAGCSSCLRTGSSKIGGGGSLPQYRILRLCLACSSPLNALFKKVYIL